MQTTMSPIMASDICHSLLTNREKTLEKIYARAYPMVIHYVKQHYGTAEDAKDLLQEAVILFYEKVMHDQLTLTSSVTTYIMGICKNLWKRELEKRSRKEELNLKMNEQVWEETEIETDSAPLKISSFVDKLGEKCKDILLSFYYFGQQMEKIAQQHDYRNVHTATVQKFKCLERLRKSVASLTIHHFK